MIIPVAVGSRGGRDSVGCGVRIWSSESLNIPVAIGLRGGEMVLVATISKAVDCSSGC